MYYRQIPWQSPNLTKTTQDLEETTKAYGGPTNTRDGMAVGMNKCKCSLSGWTQGSKRWSPVNSILAPGFSQGKNPEYHIHIHGLKLKRMIFTNAMVSMCLVEMSIFPKCMKLRKE